MTKRAKYPIGAILVTLALVVVGPALAVDLHQVDDFQDGTVMGWSEGGASPNPPINVATGGPLGVGDAFLENASSGVGGAGSKMVMFNTAQWTGDYNALGTDLTIRADMANFDGFDLWMRVAIEGANGARYVTSGFFVLPADDTWYEVIYEISDASMVLVEGSGSLGATLDDVVEMRLVHGSVPAWRGDSTQAVLGVDNLKFEGVVFKDDFETGDLSNWE